MIALLGDTKTYYARIVVIVFSYVTFIQAVCFTWILPISRLCHPTMALLHAFTTAAICPRAHHGHGGLSCCCSRRCSSCCRIRRGGGSVCCGVRHFSVLAHAFIVSSLHVLLYNPLSPNLSVSSPLSGGSCSIPSAPAFFIGRSTGPLRLIRLE